MNNIFFGKDGRFVKKQYFATNAQPSNQEYHGEIEAAFLKLLMIFIVEQSETWEYSALVLLKLLQQVKVVV